MDFSELPWKELKNKWKDIEKPVHISIGEISPEVEAGKEDHKELLKVFVSGKVLSSGASDFLNTAYGELLYHNLRSNCKATCYMPSFLGSALMSTRGSLKRKLKLIDEIIHKEEIDRDILEKEKKRLSAFLEFLKRSEDFDRESSQLSSEERKKRLKALLLLYDSKTFSVKENINIEPAVFEAVDFMVRLMK